MLTRSQKQAVWLGIFLGIGAVLGWLMWLSTHHPTPIARQPTQWATLTQAETASRTSEPLRTNTSTTATARPTKSSPPTIALPSATASPSATLPAFNAEEFALPTLDLATPGPQYTPPTAIPTPFPIASKRAGVTNILLMGTDTSFSTGQFRTDTLIVASIDASHKTVTLLTIPRDLLVYIPGIKMDRVNTAVVWGAINQYPGGGVELLKQTLLYNLGIPIDHWLVVDFNGFRHAVDALGGVDIPVSCPLQDWRLKTVPTPQAGEVAVTPDIQDEANWEQYYLDVGVRHMYGDLALWYARSRKSSSDFDRSRRQQQIIRAMFREFLAQDGLSDLPSWYERMSPYYDTDLNLPQLLQFAGLAAEMEQVQIRSRFIGRKDVYSWTTPGGAAVLLPNPLEIQRTLDEAFSPPATNRASEPYPLVLVKNETRLKSWQALAADNLAWAGFLPVVAESAESGRQNTTLIFYGNQLRGSAVGVLQDILGISDEMVRHEPQAGREPQYEILLGADYVPCQQGYVPLQRLPTPTPTLAPVLTDPSLPADSFFSTYRQVISVEGNLLDWGTLNYPLNQLVSSSDTWLNVTDSSAVWASAWDERALYFAIRVQDNTLLPASEGSDLWSGDLLELLLDLNLDADRESLLPNEDDWQLGWAASTTGQFGLGRLGWVALPSNLRGTSGDLDIYYNVLPAGYEAEFAIPWSLSGHNPQPQQHLGFVLSYFDQDSSEQSQPQSLVSTNRQRNLYDTSTWGRLILQK